MMVLSCWARHLILRCKHEMFASKDGGEVLFSLPSFEARNSSGRLRMRTSSKREP